MKSLEPQGGAERTPEKLTSKDEFAFFAIAGKISSDIIDKVYGGPEHMSEDEKVAWQKVFPFYIQRILSENPSIIDLYTTDPDTAIILVQNEIKKMHPENA